ncbi:unknown protein [Parachlamydia acanthamoebae UV-7]|uniref:Uncharacterized protein n=1 Tax=Parachlamydia acanthamoebae (strain UV7) TaxID=765952 RepID=F8KYH8_PARAV|nr:unknown protein [Parachlamydia acanthamoebae UV-7]
MFSKTDDLFLLEAILLRFKIRHIHAFLKFSRFLST